MLKRPILLLLSFLLSAPLLVGCNKSEGTSQPNLFGPPPTVSAVSVTKERKHFECSTSVDLCCVDPPTCTCCCAPDQVNENVSDLDLVTVTADVTDPDGTADILVVLARFLDPPRDGSPPGTALSQISLEMFDVGGTAVGTITIGGASYPVLTGDVTQGDGTYSRKFYMHTTTGTNLGCAEKTDFDTQQGTYSTFGTVANYINTTTRNFEYSAQAIDRAGNIDTSAGTVLPIEQSSDLTTIGPRPCGPPTGAGGCLPGTP